jgi:tRNA dimethylallyltransferase
MIKRGFLAEVKRLRKQGLSWKRIEDFGLEYREASQYLQGKIRREEMIEKAIKATEDFSRRQMTWFKKDQRIHWVQDFREAQKLLKVFLKSL